MRDAIVGRSNLGNEYGNRSGRQYIIGPVAITHLSVKRTNKKAFVVMMFTGGCLPASRSTSSSASQAEWLIEIETANSMLSLVRSGITTMYEFMTTNQSISLPEA